MSFEAYQKGVEEREKKDQEIHELKEQMNRMQQYLRSHGERLGELVKKVEQDRKRGEEDNERRKVLYDIDKQLPGWREKAEQALERLRANTDNTEDAD